MQDKQEITTAEQAAWHAGLDEGRAQATGSVSNATSRAASAAVAVPDGWKLVPIQVPSSAFLWVSGGYSADYKASDPRDQKVIDERAQSTWENILDSISPPALAATPAAAPDMVSVKQVDAYNYCRILAALGMEEEGDPVAKVQNLLATSTRLVLDYPWRDRLLDGRELVRDQQGFAEHPELPLLDEGMKPRAFFASLGVEMKHTMAEDDLSMDEYDAMSDAENWSAWIPRPPIGDAWNLVAIFDTEDGPAAWWARALKESREASPQAQADARDALTPAARDVLAERQRQITQEGYDPQHDDDHVNDEIAAMAALFIMPEGARDWDATSTSYGDTLAEALLPSDWEMPNFGDDRQRQLVKGTAMGLAEIERIDRAAIAAAKGE